MCFFIGPLSCISGQRSIPHRNTPTDARNPEKMSKITLDNGQIWGLSIFVPSKKTQLLRPYPWVTRQTALRNLKMGKFEVFSRLIL